MGSLMQDLKRQASFFLREKIKTARLVLTDVTHVQLLTEEVTNGDSLATDVHAMRLISRAAFEVDDYERIVHILHNRLSKFDAWNWRGSYKALVVLEHLLTHGPKRIAEEFQSDEDIITDMATDFHYVDHKGFNWGLCVKNKCERIKQLLEDGSYLKEERARAMKLTFGIKGFGSFSHMRPVVDETSNDDATVYKILRSKSLFIGGDTGENKKLLASNEYTDTAKNDLPGWTHTFNMEEDHPFWDNKDNQTRISLLSSV
ncbi:hypothetical protein BUALT_Bualt01G0129900 [Buddleja alternifolia]|uniref:ENTH domain-containing protein n=1 Tax=Buddleja alternifolia TaxID=168488 RepID=A0AAV6Y919_9LAMI|nr:hypothetical protein BUALT_Bualt01G0129900 [Buddleja alternifolia]